MKKEDIEQYVAVLELKPDTKYLLVVSSNSGITKEDMYRLKLPKNFLDQSILIHGSVRDAIAVIDLEK